MSAKRLSVGIKNRVPVCGGRERGHAVIPEAAGPSDILRSRQSGAGTEPLLFSGAFPIAAYGILNIRPSLGKVERPRKRRVPCGNSLSRLTFRAWYFNDSGEPAFPAHSPRIPPAVFPARTQHIRTGSPAAHPASGISSGAGPPALRRMFRAHPAPLLPPRPRRLFQTPAHTFFGSLYETHFAALRTMRAARVRTRVGETRHEPHRDNRSIRPCGQPGHLPARGRAGRFTPPSRGEAHPYGFGGVYRNANPRFGASSSSRIIRPHSFFQAAAAAILRALVRRFFRGRIGYRSRLRLPYRFGRYFYGRELFKARPYTPHPHRKRIRRA
jgi:hypothetical protein